MADLTADVMACLFILSSLTNYVHLRTTVNHNISQSTKDKLYTPTNIIRLLKNEQQLLNADKSTSPTTALLPRPNPMFLLAATARDQVIAWITVSPQVAARPGR